MCLMEGILMLFSYFSRCYRKSKQNKISLSPKNTQDFQFETEIYQICCPFIANKIVLEETRAKDPQTNNVSKLTLFDATYNGEGCPNLYPRSLLK